MFTYSGLIKSVENVASQTYTFRVNVGVRTNEYFMTEVNVRESSERCMLWDTHIFDLTPNEQVNVTLYPNGGGTVEDLRITLTQFE